MQAPENYDDWSSDQWAEYDAYYEAKYKQLKELSETFKTQFIAKMDELEIPDEARDSMWDAYYD